MDKGTERSEGVGVMKRGVGFGNMRSNSTLKSSNSREPK